jgi:hypothetical protein
LDEKAKEKNEGSARRPYITPLLIVHGSLTFLATHAAASLPAVP